MTLFKIFDIAGLKYHLELRTFANAKPYRIVLVIHNSEKSVYLWHGEQSTLKLFGKYIDDNKLFQNRSLVEYKFLILKFLTNS